MKNTESIKLVEGTFSGTEAKELVVDLISKKINFHHLKNFSSEERFGKTCEVSVARIQELKEGIKRLEHLIENAQLNNKKIVIHSEVKISLENQD